MLTTAPPLLGLCLGSLALTLPCHSLSAQLSPGESLVAVTDIGTNAVAPGQLWTVNHQTLKAIQVTLPAGLITERPNALLMQTSLTGYLGTNSGGNIYGFNFIGGKLTLTNSGKPLNTTASAGANVAQMVIVGGRIYFTTQGGTAGGVIQSIPMGGGAVTADYDLANSSTTLLANGMAAIGTTIYVGTFNSGTTAATAAGDIVAYDTVTKKGKLIHTFKTGKRNIGATNYGIGIVNMANNPAMKDTLAILGVYGDLIILDPDHANGNANPKVISHQWSGGENSTGNSIINLVNSFAYDPVRGDWVVGSRDGHVERIADGQSAEKIISGVGTGTGGFSLGAIAHQPFAKESDMSIGGGCGAQDGWVPTDSSIGAAVPGNANFELALFSGMGGENVILTIGASATVYNGAPLPIDLGVAGATGCMLRIAPLIYLPGKLTGTGSGVGVLRIKVPLLSSLKAGTTIHRQWAMDMSSNPSNTAGFVLSNARTTKF